jgi:hypothetical protein
MIVHAPNWMWKYSARLFLDRPLIRGTNDRRLWKTFSKEKGPAATATRGQGPIIGFAIAGHKRLIQPHSHPQDQ